MTVLVLAYELKEIPVSDMSPDTSNAARPNEPDPKIVAIYPEGVDDARLVQDQIVTASPAAMVMALLLAIVVMLPPFF